MLLGGTLQLTQRPWYVKFRFGRAMVKLKSPPRGKSVLFFFYRWYSSTSSTSVPPPCRENLLIQDTSGSEGSHQLLPHPTLKFFSHPRGH